MQKSKPYSKEELIYSIIQEGAFEYIFFWGSKGEGVGPHCLSQFYPAPFTIEDISYRSAEQYYMVEKAHFFNDQTTLQKIMKSKSPLEAKKLGRKVEQFDDAAWSARRFEVAMKGNRAKFGQNRKLRAYLESTKGKILVEASPHDAVWGIGLSPDDPDAFSPEKWPGENLLGFVLMKVRDEQ